MDIIDYLQEMCERVRRISHRAKSNSAYEDCRTLTRHIKYRIVREFKLSWEDFDKKACKNLARSESILDLYGFTESDRRKRERIMEFVKEYTYDLSSFIRTIERRNENPDMQVSDDDA